MSEWKYDIKPNHRNEREPLWFNLLAEWSASAPTNREYRRYHTKNMTMWFREVWFAVQAKDERIAELEAALVEILAIKTVTGGLDYEAGHEEGVTHCQSIARAARGEINEAADE